VASSSSVGRLVSGILKDYRITERHFLGNSEMDFLEFRITGHGKLDACDRGRSLRVTRTTQAIESNAADRTGSPAALRPVVRRT
jgi:hypothetical protein